MISSVEIVKPNNSYNSLNRRNNPSFNGETTDELSLKKKAAVLTGAAVGMIPAIAYFAKGKGYSLNPLKIFKTNIKDWAIFKCKPENKVIDYEIAEILSIATGSVVGGFTAGAIVDKANLKQKKREFLNQMLGNIITPVTCVWSGAKIFGKVIDNLKDMMPTIKSDKKIAKFLNTVSKNTPNGVFTLAFLYAGIFAGNKVSNYINDHVYKKKVDRNIRATDFAPHLDDVCMAISMTNKNSPFATKLGRLIPFALLVPGYETGSAREND